MYGLAQSARQFFKKLVECLKKIGFQGGHTDPCLMTRRCEKGIVYIALYVDGCYCVGHKEAIQDTITKIIANGFDVCRLEAFQMKRKCQLTLVQTQKT
jgi:hypothetical protein